MNLGRVGRGQRVYQNDHTFFAQEREDTTYTWPEIRKFRSRPPGDAIGEPDLGHARVPRFRCVQKSQGSDEGLLNFAEPRP